MNVFNSGTGMVILPENPSASLKQGKEIVIAAEFLPEPFTDHESWDLFSTLCEDIAKMIETSVKKTVYCPQEELRARAQTLAQDQIDPYSITNYMTGTVIPKSQFVLIYGGVSSYNTTSFIRSAVNGHRPFLFFYESSTPGDVIVGNLPPEMRRRHNYRTEIAYGSERELLSRLEEYLIDHFDN